MKSSIQFISVLALSLFGTAAASSEAAKLITSYKVDKDTVTVGIDKEFAEEYLKEESFFATYDEEVTLTKLPYSIVTIPFITNGELSKIK